ncbi:MAG: hypothetical protein M3R24_30910 [Chloroflexota bacterium]|nr:hypothetical protein [Chloroflexota bacterium]
MTPRFRRRTTGQALVELALVLVFVGIVLVGTLTLVGRNTSTVFSQVNSGLGGNAPGGNPAPGPGPGTGHGPTGNPGHGHSHGPPPCVPPPVPPHGPPPCLGPP